MTISWVASWAPVYLAQENIFHAGVYSIEKNIILKDLMDQYIINNENILEPNKYKKDSFWNNLEN